MDVPGYQLYAAIVSTRLCIAVNSGTTLQLLELIAAEVWFEQMRRYSVPYTVSRMTSDILQRPKMHEWYGTSKYERVKQIE